MKRESEFIKILTFSTFFSLIYGETDTIIVWNSAKWAYSGYYESPSPTRRFHSGIPSAPSRRSSVVVRLLVGA